MATENCRRHKNKEEETQENFANFKPNEELFQKTHAPFVSLERTGTFADYSRLNIFRNSSV